MQAISLIGIMGSGKTSIAKKLAKKIDLNCIDTDAEIKKTTGFSVSELIHSEQKELLNEVEMQIIEKYAKQNYIISTGDYTVHNIKAWNFLMKNTLTIWINLSLKKILERLRPTENRPLLNENEGTFDINDLSNLYKKRKRFYQKAKLELKNFKKESILKLINSIELLRQIKIVIE